jgi:hypothetical protein
MGAVVVRNLTVFATQLQHACGTQANGGKNNCCQNCPTKRFLPGRDGEAAEQRCHGDG